VVVFDKGTDPPPDGSPNRFRLVEEIMLVEDDFKIFNALAVKLPNC